MNASRTLLGLAAAAWLAAAGAAHAQSQPAVGKLDRKTGDVVSIETTSRADPFRDPRDRAPFPREFAQQPPLVPHSIEGYDVTASNNMCLGCHATARAAEPGGAKVSASHFRDRDGKELPKVSAGRYFCLQCHVPQVEAQPLVGNTFKPAPAAGRPGAK